MMNAQELIQRYESELAAAKDKIAEMQQARDDFANKNWLLQNEIERKEQQLKTLQNQPPIKRNTGWIVFFVLLSVGLGITAIVFHQKFESAKSNYYSESSNNLILREQVKKYETDIDLLTKENSILQNDISSLKSQVPVWYKFTSQGNYYYKERCGGSYGNAHCYSSPGFSVKVYAQESGYGLTLYGWVSMSHLEKH